MSVELGRRIAAPASRSPALVVVGLTTRTAVRSGALWGGVFGLYVTASALGYAAAYKTPLARARLAADFGSNFGFNAIIGPAHHLDTVAGFTAWRSLGVLSIVGAVWGLLLGTKLLRGEEDAGRWEVLLAGQTTRRRAAAQALVGLGAGIAVLWTVTAVVSVLVGRSSTVGFSPAAVLFLALALVSSAAVFACVGALASQLAATHRQAASYAGATLGASYALRMMADSGTGLDRLRWTTPLGWVEELRPLSATRPLWLLPIGALIALLAGSAVHLAGARDLGASTITDRTTARARTRLLAGPTGLTVRLIRPVLVGWGVGITGLGLMMGVIAKSVGSALSDNAVVQQALTRLGGRGAGASTYLAVTFLIVALLVSLIGAGQVSAARGEEAEGRLDHLLVRPVSRPWWLASRLAVVVTALIVAGLLAGVATWLGAASQDAGVGLGSLLQAGLNVVPPAVLVLGAGVLTLGVWPRGVSTVTYGLLAWSFLVEIIGGIVNADHWLLDTSVLHHMAAAPAVDPNWTSSAVLVSIGAAAAILGGAAFGHRDLVGE
jgi:ABC-2 type transport system permease protein